MTTISAAAVKELRDRTNVGMMECKRALVEAGGDKEKAVQLLRERGLAIAGKKASRAARSGLIAARTSEGGRTGVMIEVNCETDFVARNEIFQAFVAILLDQAEQAPGDLAPRVQDEVAAKIAEIGENIIVRRNARFEAEGPGTVATYIHLGSKVGVMIELGCKSEATSARPEFQELARDLTLHVAACRPEYRVRTEVPTDVVASEKAIFAKQVEGKPAPIIEKIVAGKIDKFFAQVCMEEQGFVKDTDRTVAHVLADTGKALGDSPVLRRILRYQLGE